MNDKYIFKKRSNLVIMLIQPFFSQLIEYSSYGKFNLPSFIRYFIMVIVFIALTTIFQYIFFKIKK